LLNDCQANGVVDADVTVGDLLKLANAISITSTGSAEIAHRLLNLMMNGLLPPAHATAAPSKTREDHTQTTRSPSPRGGASSSRKGPDST
jgi:hypothetical protein